MATRARHPSEEFFNAATKVLDQKERDRKQAEAELRRTRAAQDRAQRAHEKKIYAAFADYRKNLAPLLEALEGLPARKGEKFMVRMEQHIHQDWASKEDKRSLRIWMAYSTPISSADTKNTKVMQIPMPGEGVNDTLDVYPADNGRGMLAIKLEHNPMTGEHVMGGSGGSFYHTLKSIDDIPAYIGKWVANTAPERLNDLKKALGIKPVRKSPAPR